MLISATTYKMVNSSLSEYSFDRDVELECMSVCVRLTSCHSIVIRLNTSTNNCVLYGGEDKYLFTEVLEGQTASYSAYILIWVTSTSKKDSTTLSRSLLL